MITRISIEASSFFARPLYSQGFDTLLMSLLTYSFLKLVTQTIRYIGSSAYEQ
ncbi:hypothetical protein N480_04975 [Pseudoalteromonas luteoviolacea S2607]|uniref:hypothetical protein n=1 Tax=Pseudoalteromonas luteoviolacea TaxID=43657 RepID=UPI0007B16E96|nr:hypothetical protein [Pseudoalteromonas luteoviolacea]KZN30303.1 hypothetical protein N480_04975 [Pseudoalteromonas luteoviolacea S2607]